MPHVPVIIQRARFAIRDRGIRDVARATRRRVRNRLDMDAEHLWYELDLVGPRPTRSLAAGAQLQAAADEDLARIAKLGPTGRFGLEEYRARGGRPWLVVEGEELLFSCWIFPGSMPTVVGRRGWLPGEPESVYLEESVTAPGARGRGIAPAAWSLLADMLQRDGVLRMRTPVWPGNAAVQAALRKVGFVPVAASWTRYRGLCVSVEVDLLDERGRWLERVVAAGGAGRCAPVRRPRARRMGAESQ